MPLKEQLNAILGQYRGNISSLGLDIITAVIIGIVGHLVVRAGTKLIRKAAESNIGLDHTIATMLRYVIRYGVFLVCLIMILNTFGINTASLLAVLGAAGVAIGLALKDTLGNIAAGIILLFLRTFRKGEYIEFGSTSGTVKEIGLFATELETPDGIFISAPNSSIWGSPLKNYSRNGKRRMEIGISISYGDSIDTAFRVLREVYDSESRFLKDPGPAVILTSMGDFAVNVALRAWAATDVYWDIYWDLMRGIKGRVEAAGLTIPFPQQEVRILPDEPAPPTEPAGEQSGAVTTPVHVS